MTDKHPMITCTPGVQGGYPCIRGTRTPVQNHRRTLSKISTPAISTKSCERFPHLTRMSRSKRL